MLTLEQAYEAFGWEITQDHFQEHIPMLIEMALDHVKAYEENITNSREVRFVCVCSSYTRSIQIQRLWVEVQALLAKASGETWKFPLPLFANQKTLSDYPYLTWQVFCERAVKGVQEPTGPTRFVRYASSHPTKPDLVDCFNRDHKLLFTTTQTGLSEILALQECPVQLQLNRGLIVRPGYYPQTGMKFRTAPFFQIP